MHWSKRVAASALMIVGLSLLARPAQQGNPASAPRVAAKPARAEFFVMIDPSHGGDDKGAVLNGKLAEKDVTLALAKVLRTELEDRGIPVRLLRETDIAMSLDRRAEITNEQQAGVYVALHATTGEGVRVYTSLIAPPASAGSLPARIKTTARE